MRRNAERVSPALVVSIIALVLSVAGTGVASVATISALTKGEKRQVKRITRKVSNKQITNRAPGLSVAKAKLADAVANPTALRGALAYGQVEHIGTPSFVAARTRGFSGLTRPGTGIYCLSLESDIAGLVFDGGAPTRPTVASVEFGNTSDPAAGDAVVSPRGANSTCGANLLEVRTYLAGALSNAVSFTMIVP